jgi:hypothetical protein
MSYKYKKYLKIAITILVAHKVIQRYIHSYTSHCQLMLFVQTLNPILSTYTVYTTLTWMSHSPNKSSASSE